MIALRKKLILRKFEYIRFFNMNELFSKYISVNELLLNLNPKNMLIINFINKILLKILIVYFI